MEYMKEYGITNDQIEEIKDIYNENIIDFLEQEKGFVLEKFTYLTNNNLLIYPILKNNIKIFLEIIRPLKYKIEKMKERGYNKKMIQIVLMDQNMYDKI